MNNDQPITQNPVVEKNSDTSNTKDFATLLKEHTNVMDHNCNKKIYSVKILRYINKNKRNYAVVDCRLKTDCLCPVQELDEGHKIGDVIEVMIVSKKLSEYIEVSTLKAKMEKKRNILEKLRIQKKPVDAIVKKKVRSGYNLEIDGYLGFIKTDMQLNINETYPFYISYIRDNPKKNYSRIICVHEHLNLVNTVVPCQIKQMNEFFVFVSVKLKENDIREGIIHINDLGNRKIAHPMDKFKIGETIHAAIMRVDPKQLFLSVKHVYHMKFKDFVKKHSENDIIDCIVINAHSNGIDVSINEYVNAFIPRSESAWGMTPQFTEGDKLKAKIIELSLKNKKIILSIKQLSENPLIKFQEQYKVKDEIKFTIKDKKEFYCSAIVDGVSVRIYDTQFHWIYVQSKNKFNATKIGDTITGNIYKINNKNCTVYVTKILPEKSSSLKLNTIYECEIMEVDKSGLIVNIIGKNITGFINRTHCSKSLNVSLKDFEIGQKVNAELITFGVQKKKPLLSIKYNEIKQNKKIMKDYNDIVKTSLSDLF